MHVDELYVFTFESMTEDVFQDGNKINEPWTWVIYRLKTGAVQQSLHWKPAHKICRRWYYLLPDLWKLQFYTECVEKNVIRINLSHKSCKTS